MSRVSSGEKIKISANTWNSFVDAAVGEQSGGPLEGHPSINRRQPTIVLVKNMSGEEDPDDGKDWVIYQPIAVTLPDPDDELASKLIEYGSRPWFPGRFLDDGADYKTQYTILGICQEPIAAGKMGRVCIQGPTVALMQECPYGYTNPSGHEWVHVWKEPKDEEDEESEDRWLLRNGPSGDARILTIIDADHHYEDGTYDDQWPILIDLCHVPQRVRVWNLSGVTAPAHSIMRHSPNGHSYKLSASTTSYQPFKDGVDLIATCGWDLPDHSWGWGYRFCDDYYVKVNYGITNSQPSGMIGPASGSFDAWPYLTGFDVNCCDWYSSLGGVTQTYRCWVKKRIGTFLAKAHGNVSYSGRAWACQGPTVVFNGVDQIGGVTLPVVKSHVSFPCYPRYGSHATTGVGSLYPNVQDGVVFEVTPDPNGDFMASAAVMDDPIGTVKLWIGGLSGTIPSGWREYTGLQGKFPVGYLEADAQFGTLLGTGGSKTHTHGATLAGLSGGAATNDAAYHLPPYRTIRFIERYDP